jgi:hypothetical protein
MCVSPSGVPRDSNFIDIWEPCEPFKVTGIVREKSLNQFIRSAPTPAPTPKKFQVGALVRAHVQRKETIGSVVREVEKWCTENQIELEEGNREKIEAYIQEHYS